MAEKSEDQQSMQIDERVARARELAREAILETWPDTIELASPSPGMHEFDAILIDDESCDTASVRILHDPDANTFALVENARPKMKAPKPEPEPAAVAASERLSPGETDWAALAESHEIAHLRCDIAASSPQSFTLDEMRRIAEGMDASTAEVDAALRADFASLPPKSQAKMLDMLEEADPDHFDWWRSLLIGEMPDGVDDTPGKLL